MSKEKTRNGGEWTEARYRSFIKSALRSGSQRWPPKYRVLSEACVGQQINPASGRVAKFYRCGSCQNAFVAKDVEVDHILPVVPVTGFDSYDGLIERTFCEKDGLMVLCKTCHKSKTKKENEERKKNERDV